MRRWSTLNFEIKLCHFLWIIRNTLVSKKDTGDLMKTYAKKEGMKTQVRKWMISSITLQNGTLITPLRSFPVQPGTFVCKIHRFVEYTPKKFFNSFVQAAVDARTRSDKNLKSSVVAETMKLLANCSYGHHTKNRSQNTVTKYLNDKKTHAVLSVNRSKTYIMWTIHCMKLNWPNHRLITKSPSLSDSFFFNKQHYESWNCTTTFSQTLGCKIFRWVGNGHRFALSCSCQERTWRSHPPGNDISGSDCCQKIVARSFSPKCAVESPKNTTRENQDFSMKSSYVQWCFVSVARRTAVMMLSRTR